MGMEVDVAIGRSMAALWRRDADAAQLVIAEDERINQRRYALEDATLVLLATQQPMASDLRLIAAVIHVATELERIADHAKAVAEISLLLDPGPLDTPANTLDEIAGFADRTRTMLGRGLEAFVRIDAEAAHTIAGEDDELDAVFGRLYRELMDRIARQPAAAIESVHMLGVCYNLERISDRVTNICERTLFKATGRLEGLAGESERLHPAP